MRILTREELLNPTELKRKEEPTPELGEGTGVILQELGAFDRAKLLDDFGEGVKLAGSRGLAFLGKLLAAAIVDEDGKQLCTEDGDVEKLLRHNLDLVKRLGEVAMPLSGIEVTADGDEDDEDDEAGEPEAVKNSESED